MYVKRIEWIEWKEKKSWSTYALFEWWWTVCGSTISCARMVAGRFSILHLAIRYGIIRLIRFFFGYYTLYVLITLVLAGDTCTCYACHRHSLRKSITKYLHRLNRDCNTRINDSIYYELLLRVFLLSLMLPPRFLTISFVLNASVFSLSPALRHHSTQSNICCCCDFVFFFLKKFTCVSICVEK